MRAGSNVSTPPYNLYLYLKTNVPSSQGLTVNLNRELLGLCCFLGLGIISLLIGAFCWKFSSIDSSNQTAGYSRKLGNNSCGADKVAMAPNYPTLPNQRTILPTPSTPDSVSLLQISSLRIFNFKSRIVI